MPAVDGAPRFIDKMPINFMYCGLIAKALPGARIVHLVRDPMDTCYAVYKTLFQQAYHFSYDLEELAEYYLTYRALMRQWLAQLPREGGLLFCHPAEVADAGDAIGDARLREFAYFEGDAFLSDLAEAKVTLGAAWVRA